MKSKRNLVLGLLLAGAAVVALGSVAVASGHKGKDNDRRANKITVVERATTDTTIDNAPLGDSIGDTLAFGNQLFDKTNTKMVGTDQGSCVRTTVGVAFECTWTNSLKGGQITVEGPFVDAGDSVLAITGGTGKYRDVTGTMDLHAIDATSFMFTFHIHH
jgi:allene oxide cyclase